MAGCMEGGCLTIRYDTTGLVCCCGTVQKAKIHLGVCRQGPILAFIYAVRQLLQECKAGELDVNVAFLFEGEEENGSIGFHEAVRQNLHWLQGTRLILISNTLWVGEKIPCLTYGMRGMLSFSVEVRLHCCSSATSLSCLAPEHMHYTLCLISVEGLITSCCMCTKPQHRVEVQVSGPLRSLHSGNDGGVFNEPLADLTKVLASLLDSRNTCTVPGFYDCVRLDTLESSLQQCVTLSPACTCFRPQPTSNQADCCICIASHCTEARMLQQSTCAESTRQCGVIMQVGGKR